MLDDIIIFIHIVRQQSLSAAAKNLNISAATITRRLKNLENHLKCRLIYRSSRQFQLTSEGEVYFKAYNNLVEEFESTTQQLQVEATKLTGKLTVMAPTNISTNLLLKMWSDFVTSFPDIQFELNLNNNIEDIISTKTDIAIRIGKQPDSALYQKKLSSIKTIIIAAESYFNTHPPINNINDLNQHRVIILPALSSWHLRHLKSDKDFNYHPKLPIRVNDLRIACQLVKDGVGITLMPVSEIKQDLTNKTVQQILPEWQGLNRDVYAVWPSGRLLNAKARCFLAFLQNYIERYQLF